jgi:hypothetical protein
MILAVSGLATGCGYSASGPPLIRLGDVPHWPDCDGDGWGDPNHTDGATGESFSCREVGAAPELVQGVECAWVENKLDCDDTYDGSGADYTQRGCVANLEAELGPIGTADYQAVNDNQREFLVVDVPVTRTQAHHVCEAWSVGTVQPDENGELPAYRGVATLDTPEDRQTASSAAEAFGDVPLWTHAEFNEDRTALVWVVDAAEESIPVELDYCDGGPILSPFDVAALPEGVDALLDDWYGSSSPPVPDENDTSPAGRAAWAAYEARLAMAEYAAEAFDDALATMLVPLRFGLGDPCIERIGAECSREASGVCPRYGVICERDYTRPSDLLDFQTSGLCEG